MVKTTIVPQTMLIPAVGYVRMSTDQQADSPARQKGEIKRLAEREGFRIIRWYEDHGKTGTESANRPDFLRLLADAQTGQFEAILIYEQSRLSREDIFEAMVHWKIFRDAGVRVVSVQRGEIRFNDLGGIITMLVDQYGAHDESRKIAQRSVSGRIAKARQKKRPHGAAVFAMDRLIIDENGETVRQVHFRDKFQRARAWSERLVPSAEVAAVEAVGWAFDQFEAGASLNSISVGVNDRGICSVKGMRFCNTSIKRMLTNPVYAGHLRIGHEQRGKFSTISQEVGEQVIDDVHTGIVSDAQFKRVQRLIAVRKRPKKCRSKPGRYLLSGLITCAHCGNTIYGRFAIIPHAKDVSFAYYCPPFNSNSDPNCPRPFMKCERLDEFVLRIFRDRVLCDENRNRLIESAKRMAAGNEDQPKYEQAQLEELERKITKATKNLALADSKDDFNSVSALIQQWRIETEELERRIVEKHARLKPNVDALAAIEAMHKCRDNLHKVKRVALANALRHVVKRIVLGVRKLSDGTVKTSQFFGRIEFHPGIAENDALEFDDSDVYPDRVWRQIAEFVCDAGRPVSQSQIAGHFGYRHRTGANRHVALGVLTGLIKKHRSGTGFVKA